MKKQVKQVLFGVLLLVIAAIGIGFKMTPQKIPLTRVVPETAELILTEQGEVASSRVIQIYPLVQGEVLQVQVREGQYVKAGEVICIIDPEPIREKIKQTQNTIAGYQAQLSSESSTNAEQQIRQQYLIAQSESELAQAGIDLERSRTLFQDGFISAADYEAAQKKVETCRSALNVSQQDLKVLQESAPDREDRSHYRSLIEIENSNLLLLEKELAQSTVTAVTDGVITAVPVKETNYAGTASVAELTVTDPVTVEAYIAASDAGKLSEGDPVRLIKSSRDGEVVFDGTISRISDTASRMISALGLEEHKVKVEITPDTDDFKEHFGIGYEVEVEFILYREENQLTLPKTALFKQEGADMVWLVRSGALRAVPVTTGMELRTRTVILSGLDPDCRVVIDANDKTLKEGLRVTDK